jgi:hypothetical protein
MRALIVFLVLCLTSVLADFANYEPQVLNVPVDSTKPNGPSLSIHYYLKNNTNYKPGVPIFYGVAGRVPVEDILNQYVSSLKCYPIMTLRFSNCLTKPRTLSAVQLSCTRNNVSLVNIEFHKLEQKMTEPDSFWNSVTYFLL